MDSHRIPQDPSGFRVPTVTSYHTALPPFQNTLFPSEQKTPPKENVNVLARQTPVPQMKKKKTKNDNMQTFASAKPSVSKEIFKEPFVGAPTPVVVPRPAEAHVPRPAEAHVPRPAEAHVPRPAEALARVPVPEEVQVPVTTTTAEPTVTKRSVPSFRAPTTAELLENPAFRSRVIFQEEIRTALLPSSSNSGTGASASSAIPLWWELLQQMSFKWTGQPLNTDAGYRKFETFYIQMFLNTSIQSVGESSTGMLVNIGSDCDFPHFRAYAGIWKPTLPPSDVNRIMENFDFYVRALFEPYMDTVASSKNRHLLLFPNKLIKESTIDLWGQYFDSHLFETTATQCLRPQWVHPLGARNLSVGSLFESCVRFLKSLPVSITDTFFGDMDDLLRFEYIRTLSQLTLTEYFTFFLEPYMDLTLHGDYSAKYSFPVSFLRDPRPVKETRDFVRSDEFTAIVSKITPPAWFVDTAEGRGFQGFLMEVVDTYTDQFVVTMPTYNTLPDLLHAGYYDRLRLLALTQLQQFKISGNFMFQQSFYLWWEILTRFVAAYPEFSQEFQRFLQKSDVFMDVLVRALTFVPSLPPPLSHPLV